MNKKLLFGLFVILSASSGVAWTDGELLIWISDNRVHNALVELGKKFEKEMGVPVKVETQEGITDKFQAAAPSGKGPDIFFWANDRIGEWADAGLLKPLKIKEDFKAAFLPMAWEAVSAQKADLGISSGPRVCLINLQQEARCRKTTDTALGIPRIRQRTQGQGPKVDCYHVGLHIALL